MAYAKSIVIKLAAGDTGLALRARLFSRAGAQVGGDIDAGFTELAGGEYVWHHAGFPDTFAGLAKFYSVAGAVETYQTSAAVNPQQIDVEQVLPQAPAAGSVGESLLVGLAMGAYKLSVSGATMTLYKADGATPLKTWTLDSATNPTARTPL